ncbi:MAG: flavin reductase [Rhodospirillales bacterium]|nr:flavin reductase [Rhodospirillales bacterium]
MAAGQKQKRKKNKKKTTRTKSTAPIPALVPAEAFKDGMRRLAAGVTIITTQHDGELGGLTATAVCSLSAEPPQLLVCVNRTAAAHNIIDRGERLCVNVLARGHRKLAARFAGQNGIFGPERFRAGRWTSLTTGAPALTDALVSFDCTVSEKLHASTHTIFIGRVVDVRMQGNGKPLLYASGEYASIQALVAAMRRKRNAARKTGGKIKPV